MDYVLANKDWLVLTSKVADIIPDEIENRYWKGIRDLKTNITNKMWISAWDEYLIVAGEVLSESD